MQYLNQLPGDNHLNPVPLSTLAASWANSPSQQEHCTAARYMNSGVSRTSWAPYRMLCTPVSTRESALLAPLDVE